MKTAYHVLKMAHREGDKKPSGTHGARPGVFNGLKVVYAPQAIIKGSGYRLTATEIEEGMPVCLTMPSLNPSFITSVISDLERQRVRIGDRICAKIQREMLAKKGQASVAGVLRFRQDASGEQIIANYGFGTEGRNGIIVFGGQGVTVGDNLVAIFFDESQRWGVALACPDHDRVDTIIRDLSEQLRLAQHWQDFHCLPEADKPKGECARLFRQGLHNSDGAQAMP